MSTPTTCVIADDHEFFRIGLVKVLETMDVKVVGEASDGHELIALADQYHPDLAIIDIKMPRMNGIEAAQKISATQPDCAIIALTMYTEEPMILKMLEAGAKCYLEKDITKPELEMAITAVVNKKQFYFPQSSTARLFELMQKGQVKPFPDKGISFTSQEYEIIQLICKGLSNREIADRMNLSKRTIESHRVRIMGKMDVSNTASLVAFAYTNNIFKLMD